MKTENNFSMQHLAGYHDDTYEIRVPRTSRDQRSGRSRSLVANWEKRERSPTFEGPTSSNPAAAVSVVDSHLTNMKSKQRGYSSSTEKDVTSFSEDDVIADIIGRHDQFLGSMQSRLDKLQVVQRFWDRNDVKGAIGAMEKMADHGVVADVVSCLTEKPDIVTLEICTVLLPLLATLLESDVDRHIGISLEMLVKLVRVFGSVIYSAISASSSVGVDIEAEQRIERCNLCYIELEGVKHRLPALMRRGGSVAKSAQELNLALNSV